MFVMKKVNTNKVGGKLMTLKEEMQKNRNEEMKKMREEEVVGAKDKIRKYFLMEQLKDKKESRFEVRIFWYENNLILDYDMKNELVRGIVTEKAKSEFIESLIKELEKEEIGMFPVDNTETAWILTVELS